MLAIKVSLANDKKTAAMTFPTASQSFTMSADELSNLIRHLGWVRASMVPSHPPTDLVPSTLFSNISVIRWQVAEDAAPGRVRLFLLHPGFGWLYVRLDRMIFDAMSKALRVFLQERPSIRQ